ncbi:hypothetical protein Ccel01_15650 [Cellulosimicrobium cellulans]|uniref:Uncharacterized protein n=1 Tax=Cellulosimicrobium cellulans TaxID=1710 RepID=A0AAV5P5V3_CELCE|nr:hypothetical protein Ccel01_15650 [Cellulosimicrobium cellulans]
MGDGRCRFHDGVVVAAGRSVRTGVAETVMAVLRLEPRGGGARDDRRTTDPHGGGPVRSDPAVAPKEERRPGHAGYASADQVLRQPERFP